MLLKSANSQKQSLPLMLSLQGQSVSSGSENSFPPSLPLLSQIIALLHYHSVEQSQEISALNISNFFLDSGALWSSANSASGKVRHLSPLANNPDISCIADRFIISRAIWQSRVESCTEEVHLHRGMPPTLTLGGSEWIKLTTTEALCQTLPA